jgi:cytochrome c oxidase subunit III
VSAHAEAHAHHHGPPPANRSSRLDPATLGMFLFIASEAMLFGAFFTAYFFVRVVNPTAPETWPPEPFEFPVFVASVNTAILVTSSFTIHWATQSIKRGDRNGLRAGLVITILLGLAFLLTQAIEYAHVGFNTGDGAFASVFFGLTGLHGGQVVPRPLLAGALPRRRDPRHLLALRRRDVDHRLGGGVPPLSPLADPRRNPVHSSCRMTRTTGRTHA